MQKTREGIKMPETTETTEAPQEEAASAAPPKDKDRTDKQKLKELPFGKKLEFIWDYYKYYIIVSAVVLVIIGALLNTWVFNPPSKPILYVSWNSGFVTHEQITELSDRLTELLVDKELNEEVSISLHISDPNDIATVAADVQRTFAMVAVGAIDVFIANEDLLRAHNISGFLRPMEEMLEEIKAKNPVEYELIIENAKYMIFDPHEDGGSMQIMGINIGRSPLFSKLGVTPQDLFFSVAITSGHTENVLKALIMLFELDLIELTQST